MTSVITPTLSFNRKRVLLRRSTQQINDPLVIKEKYTPKKSVKFNLSQNTTRYFYKSHSPINVKQDPPFLEMSADDFDLSLPNWPKRNPIMNNQQQIRMEHAQLIDGDFEFMLNNQCLLEGRCRAFNSSFEKSVIVRYTFDLWSTFQEVEAKYFESIPSTQNTWDRFHFQIPIDLTHCNKTVYMALRYTVNNQEYWDNNQGKNYEIVIKSNHQDTTTIASAPAITSSTASASKEKLIDRYDFSTSLSEARKPFSPPPSPPITITTTNNYHFIPEPLPSPTEDDKLPISAEGYQMSYSDFINKYCFYNSSPIMNNNAFPVFS